MRGLVPAVAVISAAALAYEILLIRLFSIIEWHHLAFLVISLALLGYGASGTLLALTGPRMRFDVAAAAASAGFGATSIGSFLVAQRLELNSLEIFWSTRQFGTLFLLYLLFAVPFFCAATAIGLTLSRFGGESPRLYRADLLGGGISAAAMTALLFFVHPVTALQVVSCAGFAAAALFHRRGFVITAIGIAAAIAARPLALPLRLSQFKELSHALRVPEARVVAERSSPLAMLTAVESPAVPFRHAPGLSLAFGGAIPEQIGVFSDGGGMTPIVTGPQPELAFLDAMPTAVPYHLARPRSVVVIGSGGGMEVLSALHHGATAVTAVEMDPQLVALVREKSRIYDHPRVRVVTAEGRRFIRESAETYDAIQIALVGSHGSSGSGVQALSESYLYTVESMRELVGHLRPGGVLAITRWMQAPPRDIVKLLATAGVAIDDAPRRVALIRGWNTATLIVKRGDLTPSDVAALRRFCDDRSFDLEYAPGVRREETNQLNVMEGSLFDAAGALLGSGREDFLERYKFNVRPATDERPYFFHSFRWSALPELLQLRARGGMPLLEWGYLVLIAGLAQAMAAGLVLILLPLFVTARRSGGPASVSRSSLIAYFGAIGLGFLFIEIAFMQRLTFFLGHPLYAIAVVLSSFLVFGGLGSGASARIGAGRARSMPLVVAAAAVVNLLIIRTLTSAALGLPDAVKILISIAVVAPLAFVMGMPFPLGLRRLASADDAAIPWAWGINGTASVLASMLATLVAVHFGFTVLVLLAAALYVVAYTSRMPALVLVLAMFVAPLLLHAQERTLSWKSLDVEARLERDGTLVISERHVMRFDGDWNGGERIFRLAPGQELRLFAVDRIDARGRMPMGEASGGGIRLHEYRFDGTTLRWRARNASDPPFRNAERGYVIQYGIRNVIVREGDGYTLDHDFAFPDRPGAIERFSAKLELDPAWQPPDDFQASYERTNLLPGEGAVLKTTLQWKGEGQPQFLGTAPPPAPVPQPAVSVPPPSPPPPPPPVPMAQKLAALAVFVFVSLALVYWFLRGEERVGRYAPPPPVTPEWLEQHLLVHRAEVVGAAWDGATGAGEVSALLAIMADEGKIENVGGSTPKLRLLVPRESLSEYERAFVSSLFIAGDEIDPQKLRSHYASTGFDPAASIATPLENAARRLVGPGNGSSWALGCLLIVFLGFFFTLNVAAFFATLLIGSFYRSSSLGRSIAALIPVPLLIAAVLHLRFAPTFTSLILNLAVALGLLAVAVRHARWRSGALEFTNMRNFVAARDFLRGRLLNNDGEIDRRWIPYILAFGLAPELDRWSVATPRPERRADQPDFEEPRHSTPSVGGFPSSSPQVAREIFRGGGGAFGGAGATGSWTAMASFAQSVPKPQPVSTSSGSSSSSWSSGSSWSSSSSSSSSRSSGSSSGGSSRSGGGGGGGW